MTRLFPILAGVVIAAVAAGSAHALVAFNRMDKNNDGVVTFEEATSEVMTLTAVHFRKFDFDRDGVLSGREYPAFDAFLDLMYEGR